jgi:hypothetical protein
MPRKTQRNPANTQFTQINLRIPESTRLMLLSWAVKNDRSLNSEIVSRLETSLAEGSGTAALAKAIVRSLDRALLGAVVAEAYHTHKTTSLAEALKRSKEQEKEKVRS